MNIHVHANKVNYFTFFHEISASPSVGRLYTQEYKTKTSQSQLFLQHPFKK